MYVVNLKGLNPAQITELKEAFVRNSHQRFQKEIAACYHVPYGNIKACREGIETADLESLAKLIKIVGVLLQTKVYLFCNRSDN